MLSFGRFPACRSIVAVFSFATPSIVDADVCARDICWSGTVSSGIAVFAFCTVEDVRASGPPVGF